MKKLKIAIPLLAFAIMFNACKKDVAGTDQTTYGALTIIDVANYASTQTKGTFSNITKTVIVMRNKNLDTSAIQQIKAYYYVSNSSTKKYIDSATYTNPTAYYTVTSKTTSISNSLKGEYYNFEMNSTKFVKGTDYSVDIICNTSKNTSNLYSASGITSW